MAFINYNRRDEDEQLGQGQSIGGGEAPFANGGAGSGAQPGTGGIAPQWVNIQNYLGANQGTGASAKLLEQTAKGDLDQEKKYVQDYTDLYKRTADQTYQTPDYAGNKQKIGQMVDAEAGGNSQYRSGVQNYLNSNPYSATGYSPTLPQNGTPAPPVASGTPLNDQFNYNFGKGTGGKVASYGSQLNDDSNFYNGMMADMYRRGQEPGSSFTPGMMALQKNLDVNDQALKSTRDSLRSQFPSIEQELTQKARESNEYTKGKRDAYQSGQGSTKKILTDMAKPLDPKLRAEEVNRKREAARDQYGKVYQKLISDWTNYLDYAKTPPVPGIYSSTRVAPNGVVMGYGPAEQFAREQLSRIQSLYNPDEFATPLTEQNFAADPKFAAIQNFLGAKGSNFVPTQAQPAPYDLNALEQFASGSAFDPRYPEYGYGDEAGDYWKQRGYSWLPVSQRSS